MTTTKNNNTSIIQKVEELLKKHDTCGNDTECYKIRLELEAIGLKLALNLKTSCPSYTGMSPHLQRALVSRGAPGEEACMSGVPFHLTPAQMFVKHWMRDHNGLLLFHGVGTGKTCTAITVAEDHMIHGIFKRPALVITPKALRGNFRRQVCDITKSADLQCTGSRYMEMIPDKTGLNRDQVWKRMERIIDRFYETITFQQLGNMVKSVLESIPKDNDVKLAKELRSLFSDRMIIIDEVHNLKIDDSLQTSKIVPPLLELAIRHAHNCKLLLLSATPMYDEPQEIVFLLNLLLLNDKQPLIEGRKAFKGRELTDYGKQQIQDVSRYYVSYVSGKNPITFPTRLYPTQKVKELPTYDIYGIKLDRTEVLSKDDLVIVPANLGSLQKKIQKLLLNSKDASLLLSEDTDDVQVDDSIVESKTTKAKGQTWLTESANITYPAFDLTSKASPESYLGKKGLQSCFIANGSKSRTYAYEPRVLKDVGAFLDIDKLRDHAPKMANIIDSIKTSKGVIYVYTRFIYSGIIPLALALEHAGFTRYNAQSLLAPNHRKNSHFLVNGKAATYTILSGDQRLSGSTALMESIIATAKSDANTDGQIIKVMLCSSLGTEGLDLRFIREVHILDPWYNTSRLEQTIGRATRQCSHFRLPTEQRNVTIYYHAVVNNKHMQEETIDTRMYRIAMSKKRSVQLVEKIMQANAVDCFVEQAAMNAEPNIKMKVETSQGKSMVVHSSTMTETKQKCICSLPTSKSNEDNWDWSVFSDEFPRYISCIKKLYEIGTHYTYDEISKHCKNTIKGFDDSTLLVTLQRLLQDKTAIKTAQNKVGCLVFIGGFYMFQPVDYFPEAGKLISLDERKEPHNIRETKMKIIGSLETNAEADIENEDANTNINKLFIELNNRVQEIRSKLHIKIAQMNESKTLTETMVDMVVDRLRSNELQMIVGSMVRELVEKKLLAKFKMQVLNSLRRTRGVFGEWPKIEYYFDPEMGKFYNVSQSGECLPVIAGQRAQYLQTMMQEQRAVQPFSNTFVGYIQSNPNHGKFAFKIRNPNVDSQGFVCEQTSTLTTVELQKRISELNIEIPINFAHKYVKTDMCLIYELALRMKGESTFARPYQSHLMVAKRRGDHSRI